MSTLHHHPEDSLSHNRRVLAFLTLGQIRLLLTAERERERERGRERGRGTVCCRAFVIFYQGAPGAVHISLVTRLHVCKAKCIIQKSSLSRRNRNESPELCIARPVVSKQVFYGGRFGLQTSQCGRRKHSKLIPEQKFFAYMVVC